MNVKLVHNLPFPMCQNDGQVNLGTGIIPIGSSIGSNIAGGLLPYATNWQ